jgi:sodium/hydrogen exchanger 8
MAGFASSEWSIVVGLGCVLATFLIGRALERRSIDVLPEAGVAMLLGAAVGAVASALGADDVLTDMRFDFEFFMIWLLPPIIFEAGYNMNRRAFFHNLMPTSLLAFGGTLASAAVVAAAVYGAGAMGLCHDLGGLAALYFGTLISATDPVTVLALFARLGVSPDLFALVFGESVLNDAVALVLSRTLLAVHRATGAGAKDAEEGDADGAAAGGGGGAGSSVFTTLALPLALVLAIQIFALSVLIGVGYGAGCSLLFSRLRLGEDAEAIYVEAAIVVACAWAANYTAEALSLSGIVAILVCGVVMAKYCRSSMSEPARVLTARAFKVSGGMGEAGAGS